MEKIFFVLAISLLSLGAMAQCNQYYKLKKGTSWTISSYDAKGKSQGKTIQEVTAYTETADGFEATFKVTSVDKKGEQTVFGSSTIRCEGGVVYFDLEDMFPEEQMESMKEFDMSIDGVNIELPSTLKAGQQLKDANVVLHIEASPMKMNFKIDITERKVIGEENLHTPAGEFDCFKISQKVYMKTMGKIEMHTIEWYSKEVGMVKSETYDKKDKLKSYSILTAYNY